MNQIIKSFFVFAFLCLLCSNVTVAQKCRQCGTSLASNAKFCQECGTKVSVTTSSVEKKIWFSSINLVPGEVVNGVNMGLGVHLSFHIHGYKGQNMTFMIELFDKDGYPIAGHYPDVVPSYDQCVYNDYTVYFSEKENGFHNAIISADNYSVRAYWGDGDIPGTWSKSTYITPDGFALSEAGKWYHKGCQYLEKDDNTNAFSCFRKAAELGDFYGQARLGQCYINGSGVPRNYSEAVKWFRKAANQGVPTAQERLGYCYENGLGVTKDISLAVSWYRKAAENNYSLARNRLKALGY